MSHLSFEHHSVQEDFSVLEDVELYANSEPIGTGPMKFAGWTEGATISLTRKDQIWSIDSPTKLALAVTGNFASHVSDADLFSPSEIAEIFFDIIFKDRYYKNAFEHIYFAILGNENFQIFQQTFRKYKLYL